MADLVLTAAKLNYTVLNITLNIVVVVFYADQV